MSTLFGRCSRNGLFTVMFLIFCDFRNSENAADTHWTLQQAFGEQASNTFEWFKQFEEGGESIGDGELSGRQSSRATQQMIVRLREVTLQDKRQTIHDATWCSEDRFLHLPHSPDLASAIVFCFQK